MKIKALEWKKEYDDHYSASAHGFPWSYEMREAPFKAIRIRIGTTGWHPFTGTMEEAKAFMQEDYDKRVRACLEDE